MYGLIKTSIETFFIHEYNYVLKWCWFFLENYFTQTFYLHLVFMRKMEEIHSDLTQINQY